MSTSTYPVATERSDGAVPPELAARLNDPQVAAQLGSLLDHLDVLNLAVASLSELFAHSETILDSVVDSLDDARTLAENTTLQDGQRLDVKATTGAATELIGALPRMTPALLRGVDSGAIDALTSPALVRVLRLSSDAADSALAGADPVEAGGPVALLRALRDPDVARALSFFLTLARDIGRGLPAAQSTHRNG